MHFNYHVQGRKFEGNMAEASAEVLAVHAAGGLGPLFFFLSLFFKNLAEAAASAASMQFTAVHVCICSHSVKLDRLHT